MSSGTRDEQKRPPVRWPEAESATAVLRTWLAGPSDARAYATDLDFRGVDLTDVDFYYFFGVKCDFRATVLVRTYLGGSYIADCDFTAADMRQVILAKAEVGGSTFDRAVLREANLRGIDAQEASFVGSNLSGAAIDGYLADCDFTDADLSGARIEGVFSRAVVTNLRVTGTTGSIHGPLVVREDGQERILDAQEAESWLAARGADVTVRSAGS